MTRVILCVFLFCCCSVICRSQDLKQYFEKHGLIDVHQVNKNVLVDLRYSSTNNFMKADLYKDLKDCFLQPEVAEKLAKAEEYLEEKYPYYRLLLLDCARPKYIQKLMWDTVKDNISEKVKFLSNPDHGSLHNYGAAVDVTLADENGFELDMGTEYDHKGRLAYPEAEEGLLKEGLLTYRQVENRKLLREVMRKGGFFNIQTEWWHFNAYTRSDAADKFKLID